MNDTQKQVLEILYEILQQDSRMTTWSSGEENGITDMVLTEHKDIGANDETILGEYTFLPLVEENQQVWQFSVSEVLADDISPEGAARLYKPLCRVNALLPCGAFLISSDDKVLSYHRVITCPADRTAEELFEYLRGQIEVCLQLTSLWMAALLYLETGELSLEAFEKSLADWVR